jgi:hypothetical protein
MPVKGTAERPLDEILRAVLPVDWRVTSADGAMLPRVTPPAEHELTAALRAIVAHSNSCLTLDGEHRVVEIGLVSGAPAVTTVPLAPMPSAAGTPPLAPLGADLAAEVGQEGFYALHPGQTLKQAFTLWAQSAGYSLVWSAPIDLPIEAEMTYPPGTRFEDAVRQTLAAFWRSKHAVVGKLYRNRVLVITGRDA